MGGAAVRSVGRVTRGPGEVPAPASRLRNEPPLPGVGEFTAGGVPPQGAPAEPRLPAGERRGGRSGGRGGRGRRARGGGGAARQQIEQQQAAEAQQRCRYLAGEPHGRGGWEEGKEVRAPGTPPARPSARPPPPPTSPGAGTWPPSPGPAPGSGGGARPTVLSGLAAPSPRRPPQGAGGEGMGWGKTQGLQRPEGTPERAARWG